MSDSSFSRTKWQRQANLDGYGMYRVPDDLNGQCRRCVSAHSQADWTGDHINIDGEFDELPRLQIVGDDAARNDPDRIR